LAEDDLLTGEEYFKGEIDNLFGADIIYIVPCRSNISFK